MEKWGTTRTRFSRRGPVVVFLDRWTWRRMERVYALSADLILGGDSLGLNSPVAVLQPRKSAIPASLVSAHARANPKSCASIVRASTKREQRLLLLLPFLLLLVPLPLPGG